MMMARADSRRNKICWSTRKRKLSENEVCLQQANRDFCVFLLRWGRSCSLFFFTVAPVPVLSTRTQQAGARKWARKWAEGEKGRGATGANLFRGHVRLAGPVG